MRKLAGYFGIPSVQVAVGYALLLLTVVWLTGCAPQARSVAAPVVPAAEATAGGTVVLSGARGFAAAELAYITAADGVGRLTRAGVIRGPLATQVRGWNQEARRLLVTGKATVDATEKARAAAGLFGISDRLNGVLGRN